MTATSSVLESPAVDRRRLTVNSLARWSVEIVAGAASAVVTLTLAGLLGIVVGDVVARNFFGTSFLWEPELTSLGLSIMTFIGGAIGYRHGKHIAIKPIRSALPERYKDVADAFSEVVVAAVSIELFFDSVPLLSQSSSTVTPILNISQTWFVATLTIGMGIMVVFALEKFARFNRRVQGTALLAFVVVAAVEAVLVVNLEFATQSAVLTAMLASIIVLLCCGVPIGFVLAAGGALYILYTGIAPDTTSIINMGNSTSGFTLVAIPFFILAGVLLTAAGLARRLAALGELLVGWLPGGLLHVVVVVMYMFSGLSGSKVADVAAVGTTMRGPMADAEYSPSDTAAIVAASAIMGESVPPSLIIITLGSIASVSIGGLFAAGIIPAALIALLLIGWICAIGRRRGRGGRTLTAEASPLRIILRAIPALSVPLILVIGILGGYTSPSEVSGIAVVAALVACFASRAGNVRLLMRAAVETSAIVGMVLFIIAGASNLSWSLAVSGIVHDITGYAQDIHNRYLFMLVTLVVLPIFGTLLEGLPAVLIFGPLLVPAAEAIGISPLQYGMVFIISMGLGTFAPPIGVGFYTTCAICESPVRETARKLLRYYPAIVIGVVLIALIPKISLWLPHQLGLA